MVLCAAAIAFTGWHVAWEHLFERAFATPNTMMVGFMCVAGFVSWVFLAAEVFIWMQTDIRVLWRHRVGIQERAAARRRLDLLLQSHPNPRNARTIITNISKVKR
jgi:hypothetical protein